jgi:hypothetical protein
MDNMSLVHTAPQTAVVADTFEPYDDQKLFDNIKEYPDAHQVEKSAVRRYILSDRAVPVTTQQRLGPLIRSLDEITEKDIAGTVFYICFTYDSDALPALRKIKQHGGKFIPSPEFRKTSYRFTNRLVGEAMRKTWAQGERVSHLDFNVHENICEAIEITSRLDGDYVEIGVYKGGSALTALNYMAGKQAAEGWSPRKVWLLDTFAGMSYPEAQTSIDRVWNNTHQLFGVKDTQDYLKTTLDTAGLPYQLVESNICADELPTAIGKIAVANIDVDVYEATLAAFYKVATRIVPGGIIIAEDPASTPFLYGAYLAMQEFLESDAGKPFLKLFKKGQYFLVKR